MLQVACKSGDILENLRAANIRNNDVVDVILYNFGAVYILLFVLFCQVVRIPIIVAALNGPLQDTVRTTNNG